MAGVYRGVSRTGVFLQKLKAKLITVVNQKSSLFNLNDYYFQYVPKPSQGLLAF